MVSGVEEVSPGGGSRGGRRVVISRSFLRCRRVRGSSRGGSAPPPLLLPLVLSLLPGLGWPDPGVCLFWVRLFLVEQRGCVQLSTGGGTGRSRRPRPRCERRPRWSASGGSPACWALAGWLVGSRSAVSCAQRARIASALPMIGGGGLVARVNAGVSAPLITSLAAAVYASRWDRSNSSSSGRVGLARTRASSGEQVK